MQHNTNTFDGHYGGPVKCEKYIGYDARPPSNPLKDGKKYCQSIIYTWRSRAEKRTTHEVWHRTWQYLALPHPVHARILCPGFLTAQMHPFHQHLILFKPSSNFLRPSSSSLSGSKPASTAYSLQNTVRACTSLTSSRAEIFRKTGNQMSWMHCRVDFKEVGFVTRVWVR